MTRARHARLALPQRRLPHPRRRLLAHLRAACGRRSTRTRTRSTYITNGVHVPTFLAQEWSELFEQLPRLRLARSASTDRGFWQRVRRDPRPPVLERAAVAEGADAAPGALPRRPPALPQPRLARRTWIGCSSSPIPLNPNVLTIGFARRFATYKRATLLFEDLDWLRQLVCDDRAAGAVHLRRQGAPGRPAGPGPDPAASPQIARMPEFEGRILLVEDYDLRLARRLVSGRGRLAQQSDLSAGGERHLRHEGRA